MVIVMEVLGGSTAVSAVSFLSCPPKRKTRSVPAIGMLNFHSLADHKRKVSIRASEDKAEKVKVNWARSSKRMMRMMMMMVGSTSSAMAADPRGPGYFDLDGPVNDVAAFLDRYPFFAFGVSCVVFFVFPLLSDQVEKSQKWTTAEQAYSKLRDDVESQLLDIRSIDDITNAGSPEISRFNKKLVQITYTRDNEAFLIDVLNTFKDPAKTTLYILDKYDGKSMQVAQMLTRNGFKAAYAIRDGYQGNSGWQAVEEKLFTDTTHKDTRSGATVSPNQEVNVFTSSVVNNESVESQTESRSIPSSTASEVRTVSESRRASVESASTFSDQKLDVPTLATEISSQAVVVEVASETPCLPRALSPYPQYPELKPPTSPTPSKPTSKAVNAVTNNDAVRSPKKVDSSTIENPCFSWKLSPYTQYADLKPPTSPMPSKPTMKSIDATTKTATVSSDQNVDISSPATESAPLSSSRQLPIEPATITSCFSRPLSPYTMYPDLRPPMSPTPSKPIVEATDAATNNGSIIDQILDVSAPSIESALHSSSQPLSPFSMYPDRKPPTTPTQSKLPAKSMDHVTCNGPVISDQSVTVSAPKYKTASVPLSLDRENEITLPSEPAVGEPGFEASLSSTPLSPYPSYPDLKPPTSPTPSRP